MAELERGPRIQFQERVEESPRDGLPVLARRHSNASQGSLSIHTVRSGVSGVTAGRQTSLGRVRVEYRTISVKLDDQENKPDDVILKGDDKIIDELANTDWHTIAPEELYKRLATDTAFGLSAAEVQARLITYGRNVPSPPPSRLGKKLLQYMFGGFGSLLLVAGILVLVSYKPLGQPPALANLALGIVLLTVFVIQAFFNGWQDFSSSRVMDSIKTMLPDDCLVIRGGEQTRIAARDLVPGDVVLIRQGNKIPVDARLVQVSIDLKFDRSILTGESKPLAGTTDCTEENYLETKNIALQGTHCVMGTGVAVCVDTGDNTVFGRIAKLSSRPRKGLTTLQREILRFVLIVITCVIVFVVAVIIVWTTFLHKKHPDWLNVPKLIVACVSVAVAFVPEGLPIALTTCLTITASAMRKQKILCKSLATVETLGSVSIICSDKTGTLTMNKMFVTDYSIGDTAFALGDRGSSAPNETELRLQMVAGVCNAGEFDPATDHLPIQERKIHGDATDQAILRFAEILRPISELPQSWRKVHELPFNSKNKFMLAVADPVGSEKTQYTVMMKGAPDILSRRCSTMLQPDGSIVPLDGDKLQQIQISWALEGKRVLLLAAATASREQLPGVPGSQEFADQAMEFASNNLTVIGMVGIVDPPRDEIPSVVSTLRGAGIRLFMVTGDFRLTAQSIARTCNILTVHPDHVHDFAALDGTSKMLQNEKSASNSDLEEEEPTTAIMLEGPELNLLTDPQWDLLFTYNEIIFSRTTPQHKLRIVKEFQKRGAVVGMTGDGVNDAPSLKAADVGIAVSGGSDVAIEAADMVLLDNFSAIVEAVKHGRAVFDNLRKTLAYLLPAGSFSELMPVLLNVFFGLPQVLSSFLMIMICCFSDCAGAMTLAYEKPESDILTRGPRNTKKDHLADGKLLLHAYITVGFLECVSSMSMSFWYMQRHGVPFSVLWLGYGALPPQYDPVYVAKIQNEASSIYYVTLVIMQWFNLLATRTRRLSIFQMPPIGRKASQNLYLGPAILFALLNVFIWCYIPKIQETINSTQVAVEHWFLPFAFGAAILILDELRKYWVRRCPTGIWARLAW